MSTSFVPSSSLYLPRLRSFSLPFLPTPPPPPHAAIPPVLLPFLPFPSSPLTFGACDGAGAVWLCDAALDRGRFAPPRRFPLARPPAWCLDARLTDCCVIDVVKHTHTHRHRSTVINYGCVAARNRPAIGGSSLMLPAASKLPRPTASIHHPVIASC